MAKIRSIDVKGENGDHYKLVFSDDKILTAVPVEEETDNPDPDKYNFERLYNKYLQFKSAELKITSVDRIESIFRNHILPYFKNYDVRKIDKLVLLDWKEEILRKNLNDTTNRNIYTYLNTFLKFLVLYEYIDSNELEKIGLFKRRNNDFDKEKTLFYTTEQMKRFLEYDLKFSTLNSHYPYYAFDFTAFMTGARKGELGGLTWEDVIDFKYISINKSNSQKIKGQANIIIPPKTKSSVRIVELPEPCSDVLKIQKKLEMERIKLSGTKWSDKGFVFRWENPLRDTTIQKHIDKVIRLANSEAKTKDEILPHISPHAMRHSHASFLYNSGVVPMEIARRLGHADLSITLATYSHIYDKENDKVIDLLNKTF